MQYLGYTYIKTKQNKTHQNYLLVYKVHWEFCIAVCKGETGTKSKSYPHLQIKPAHSATSLKLPEQNRVFLPSGPPGSLSFRKMEGSWWDAEQERGSCLSVSHRTDHLTAISLVLQAKPLSILWQRPMSRTQQLEMNESFRVSVFVL